MSRPQAARPMSPSEEDSFPSPQFPRPDVPGAPSIISSRMTDIGSDDGHEIESQVPGSPVHTAADVASRPGTAVTASSSRGNFPLSARRNYQNHLTGKRGSMSSVAASNSGRTLSLTSRSHVPSITSNAFFRPMSSQKLQAQRGGNSRPPTRGQPQPHQLSHVDDNDTDAGGSIVRQSITSIPIAQVQSKTHEEDSSRLPPSRGSDMTEHEAYDRITTTTSPTQGHYQAGSTTDSVRPLNRPDKSRHLTKPTLDGSSKKGQHLPSPVRSTRSFRSAFLIPSRSDPVHQSRNRSTEGAEKLSSGASSPRLQALDAVRRPLSPEHELKNGQAPTVGRVFEYFEGNTRFCFGGRWQNTRQNPVNIATGFFVVAPCVLFFVFEASWLWHNISPALPLIFAYLAYVCFSSFFHASVSDPGILPRNLHQFPPVGEDDDPLRIGPPTNDWTLIKSAESNTAAMEVPVKHCRTCNIWRPPRAHHCRLCDNCIEGHDHHCVWLNNCIGKRNYRYFFTFVTSATILSAYLIALSLTQLIMYKNREGASFNDAIAHFPGPFALFVIGFLGFLYPAALMGYHIFLMARGETTREYMNSHKFVKNERFRAFTQSNAFRNFVTILCRPRPPTYYQFKAPYNTGDQRLRARPNTRPRTNSQGLEMQDVTGATQQGGFQGPVALRQEARV